MTRMHRLAWWSKQPGRDGDRLWARLIVYDFGPTAWLWSKLIEEHLCRLACWMSGHVVIDDHCGLPEHRHCMICRTVTPNADVTT